MKKLIVLTICFLAALMFAKNAFSEVYLSPDGTGTYVGGLPDLMPNGAYVGGTPAVTSNDVYVDGKTIKKNTYKKGKPGQEANS